MASRYTEKHNKMYEKYKADLLKKRIQVESVGGEMLNSRPLSKRDYLQTYKNIYSSRKYEVQQGTRKSVGNIRRDLINGQTYLYSQAQAQAIKKAYLTTLPKDAKGRPIYEVDDDEVMIKPKIKDIRLNINYINDTIIDLDGLYELSSTTYKKYLEQGKTSEEAKRLVSQEIWGSP